MVAASNGLINATTKIPAQLNQLIKHIELTRVDIVLQLFSRCDSHGKCTKDLGMGVDDILNA